MSLPISVVVPHIQSRKAFFESSCFPSIVANDPAEIFIETGEKNACEKRNAGAAKATQPFLVFVDDDGILHKGAFLKMLSALHADRGASFAYCDTEIVRYPGIASPHPAGRRTAIPWDYDALRKCNYIDTMSLIRRLIFPKFDPSIRRYQDWDLWLTLAERGHRGIYIPEVLFESHQFDFGISASVSGDEALRAIQNKHGCP